MDHEYLTNILLDDNVVRTFHFEYESNKDFKDYLLNKLPQIEDCVHLKQDNPWHIYNCFDHILHSIEEINKLSKGLSNKERELLAYTMLLHDIGKPQCHLRRYSKLYGREIDSFFGHAKVGKELALKECPSLGFSEQETKEIAMLVEYHDCFINLVTEPDENKYHILLNKDYIIGLMRLFDEVGESKKLIKYLAMVGRADSMAQNPALTGASFKVLDFFDKLLSEMI